jgi:hypothetical protein
MRRSKGLRGMGPEARADRALVKVSPGVGFAYGLYLVRAAIRLHAAFASDVHAERLDRCVVLAFRTPFPARVQPLRPRGSCHAGSSGPFGHEGTRSRWL